LRTFSVTITKGKYRLLFPVSLGATIILSIILAVHSIALNL